MVVVKDPGSVPENWRPVLDEESADVVDERSNINYCSRCQNNKPPRCHHCSVCQYTFFCRIFFFYGLSFSTIRLDKKIQIVLPNCRSEMRSKDGSSLCVGRQLCGRPQLQVLLSFSGTLNHIFSYSVFLSL